MGFNSKKKLQLLEERREKRPHAIARHIRISPYKVRSVIDLVRGKHLDEAVAILLNLPKSSSEPVLKVINSAAANAEHNMQLARKDLIVAEIFADQGPVMKRMVPKAKGSAGGILKRSSHITVILDEVKEESK